MLVEGMFVETLQPQNPSFYDSRFLSHAVSNPSWSFLKIGYHIRLAGRRVPNTGTQKQKHPPSLTSQEHPIPHMYGLGPVHTGSDTQQYTYMFFIKLATEYRLFYKEQISSLSRVASRVHKPLFCSPFIVLADVGLRADLQSCDICVLVEHVQVVVRRHAEERLVCAAGGHFVWV